MFPNFIIFTGFQYGFSYLMCQRLDKETTLSFIVILIPFWIIIIYGSAFVVILGLSSQNAKVKKCDKIFLSLLVPIGFITSLILALCVADGTFQSKFVYCFIPTVASFLFLYIYARCLLNSHANIFANNAKVDVEERIKNEKKNAAVAAVADQPKPQFYN